MSRRGRSGSVAQKIQSPRTSQDDTLENSQHSNFSQNSENSKRAKAKNYSADESAAIIRCTDKFCSIINLNSNRDKDKQQKQSAWKIIKHDFDVYCKSQGFYVSEQFLLIEMKKKFVLLI